MRARELFLSALALSLLVIKQTPSSAAGVTETVVHGTQEILYLDGLANPSRWGPAECTVTVAPKKMRADGRPTLHLFIPVDYHAGEKKYPIGWPRMYCDLVKPDETRWADYDRFEFMIYARMSRKAPPRKPLTFQIHCPDRRRGMLVELTQMKLNHWVRISIRTSDIPNVEKVARLGFNIAESHYRDGDKLDFYLGGFRLVRSLECELLEMKTLTPVIYVDRPEVKLQVVVTGPPANVSRGIPFTVRKGAARLRKEMLPVQRGKHVITVDVSELKLPPGDYEIVAFEGVPTKEKKVTFRVVNTPWKRTRP